MELHGIGKKITPWSLIEGEFFNNQLYGFGRSVLTDGSYAMGWFYNDEHLQGYGYRVLLSDLIDKEAKTEGHWDCKYFINDDPCDKKEITRYNPNVDKVAMKVDDGKYIISIEVDSA